MKKKYPVDCCDTCPLKSEIEYPQYNAGKMSCQRTGDTIVDDTTILDSCPLENY